MKFYLTKEPPTIICPDDISIPTWQTKILQINTTGSFMTMPSPSLPVGTFSTTTQIIDGRYHTEVTWTVGGLESNTTYPTEIPVTWTLSYPSFACSNAWDESVKTECESIPTHAVCTTRIFTQYTSEYQHKPGNGIALQLFNTCYLSHAHSTLPFLPAGVDIVQMRVIGSYFARDKASVCIADIFL